MPARYPDKRMATNPLPATATLGAPLRRRRMRTLETPMGKPAISRRPGRQSLRKNGTDRVKYVFYRQQAFHLRRAITLKVSRKGGFWVHSYKSLGIDAY